MRVAVQPGNNGVVGSVTAAQVFQAVVLGEQGVIDLLRIVGVVIPGGAVETVVGQHLQSVVGDAIKQGVPMRELGALRLEKSVHARTVDQVVDPALAPTGAVQQVS